MKIEIEKSDIEKKVEKLERENMMLETALIAMKHNKRPKYSIIYWKEKYRFLDSTDDRLTSIMKDESTWEYYCFDTLEEAEKCMDRIMFAEQVVVKEYY